MWVRNKYYSAVTDRVHIMGRVYTLCNNRELENDSLGNAGGKHAITLITDLFGTRLVFMLQSAPCELSGETFTGHSCPRKPPPWRGACFCFFFFPGTWLFKLPFSLGSGAEERRCFMAWLDHLGLRSH